MLTSTRHVRSSEMVHHIRLLITAASSPKKPTTTLTLEQRNLFSVAYKNLVTPQRTAYRTISWILEREQRKKHERAVRLCEVERERVGREVVTSCEEVIEVSPALFWSSLILA